MEGMAMGQGTMIGDARSMHYFHQPTQYTMVTQRNKIHPKTTKLILACLVYFYKMIMEFNLRMALYCLVIIAIVVFYFLVDL